MSRKGARFPGPTAGLLPPAEGVGFARVEESADARNRGKVEIPVGGFFRSGPQADTGGGVIRPEGGNPSNRRSHARKAGESALLQRNAMWPPHTLAIPVEAEDTGEVTL